MLKNPSFKWCCVVVVSLTALSFAGQYDYAFPSPLPPTGDTAGVKQIVSFIWDDNAYSGKNGTNYEGSDWTEAGGFASQSWTGGVRYEGDWAPTNGIANRNPDGLKEGDYGMAWAAKTLAGYESEQVVKWHPGIAYQKDMQVVYEGAIWKSGGYRNPGLFPMPSADPTVTWDDGRGWTKVKELSAITPTKTNPDGKPITMTFNVISGFFVPIERGITGETGWTDQISKFGFFKPDASYYPDGNVQHTRVAMAWGREMTLYNPGWGCQTKTGAPENDPKLIIFGYINQIFEETIMLGHEVGNHTIDHLETNSVLPLRKGTSPYGTAVGRSSNVLGEAYLDGFARWGGDGFDSVGIDTVFMPDGEKLICDEAKEFGQKVGAPQQYMGWQAYIGKVLSKKGWEGLIKIGEEQITEYLGLSSNKKNCVSFRAPRLEVNSNMFWALRDLGYLYDCGNEEGYEYNMDGTNYLWPYTLDNGSPNVAWQRMAGENKSNFDSLPAGFWQYPVSVLIVPQDHRQGVFNNYKIIAAAEGNPTTPDDEAEFLKNGKITGFDFNLFILNGASKEAAIATMRHSLDQRMKGGKAPFQIGCHTDYFTPIYDMATLGNAVNKNTYGLVVKNGWNTWKDRIKTWEDIRDYGLSKPNVYFLDGGKTIDYVKELVEKARVGKDKINITDIGQWEFFNHQGTASANTNSFNGNIVDAKITTEKFADLSMAGYAIYGDVGKFEFDHISLSYSTSAPLTIRLITEDGEIDEDYPYEITLSNLNGYDESVANKNYYAHSGQIPVSAFQRNQYVGDDFPDKVGLQAQGTPYTKKIKGIEVMVQVPEDVKQVTSLSIKDFILYSGEQTEGITTGIANKGQKALAQKITVSAITSNALKLNLVKAGIYNVDFISINGRVIKSFKDINMSAGINTLSLNSVAKGMYMIRIHNKNFNTSLKAPVL
jgi:peptidoglycan/xylan/chitin deacetylase (PgdA/CDA1 family)